MGYWISALIRTAAKVLQVLISYPIRTRCYSVIHQRNSILDLEGKSWWDDKSIFFYFMKIDVSS